MSEYTPTTEFVRRKHARISDEHGVPILDRVREAEFDRWLAEERRAAAEKAYEQGRNDERHDCDRYAEHQQGRVTDEQLKRDLRSANPYRAKEAEA